VSDPLFDLEQPSEVFRAIGRVVDSGDFIGGRLVTECEQHIALMESQKYCVSCASGTDALRLVLVAKGIGPGDAVVIPDFTFTATANAVISTGATPVFADVDEHGLLSPSSVEQAVHWIQKNSVLAYRGVIPVDLYGRICQPIADTICVDGAQSFGVPVPPPATKTLSFFPTKPLGALGDGGAVVTDDEGLAEEVRSIANHGVDCTAWVKRGPKDNPRRWGWNSRLDAIQAAVLTVKMKTVQEQRRERAAIAEAYSEGLSGYVQTPSMGKSAWALYTIRSPHRDAIQAAVSSQTGVYYRQRLSLMEAFQTYPRIVPAVWTWRWVKEALSLPCHSNVRHLAQTVSEVRCAVEEAEDGN
jgi:dTDP-4-amino-4,6-dideoxygalactose transaminase